jgi:flagellar assembly protein FliH
MSLAHLYQQFGNFASADASSGSGSAEAIEDEKLASFEAGYQAGWDDAVKAQADEKAHVGSEFAQNLQEMSFTFHEAHSRLTAALNPLMKQIVDKLLPRMARESLGGHILEQLEDMIGTQLSQPIQIIVSPRNADTVEALAAGALKDPFTVEAEDTLGDGQCFVRIGNLERFVDLDAVISEIAQAAPAVFERQEIGT